jgi:DNA primase catalytic core
MQDETRSAARTSAAELPKQGLARIPQEELERIKSEVSLERLVQMDGVELRRQGADLIGRCPFHDDKTPSLVVTPKKNLWHCLGACRVGGSVIDWVMRSRRVSFRHAVEILRGDVMPTRLARLALLPGGLVEPSAADDEVLAKVVGFYHETLRRELPAREFLERRGIKNEECIEHFKLGYANRTLTYRLPPKTTTAGHEVRERMERLGILRASSGHEHFNGSVVVPILDEHGRVRGMYGRKATVDCHLRKGTPLHLYLPGPHRGVFNVSALREHKTVILCEAVIDALTFWCAGFRNVTTSYGVEGFTDAHLRAFRRYGTERVLIAYDRDEAGDRAADVLAERLMSEGLECLRVVFPHGMDANEYALKVRPAEKSLGILVQNAQWLGKGRGALRPLSADEEELDAPPPSPAPPDPQDASPPAKLALRTLFSWRERVLTRAVPKRSSAALVDDAAAEGAEAPGVVASGEGDVSQGELAADVAESSHARARASSSLSLAAIAAKDVESGDDGQAEASAAELEDQGEDLCDEDLGVTSPATSILPPAPVPAPTTAAPTAEGKAEHEEVIVFEDRRYRVRGLEKNLAFDLLRVNLLAARGEALHVDTLDLYSARARAVFVKQVAIELRLSEELVKRDVGRVILRLEELQEQRIKKALEVEPERAAMLPEEREAALELLQDPRLVERILSDFAVCGVVGEETNKLLGYLAAVSRKLEEPLAVIVQSSSSAGKSSLMEAVLAFVPEEDRVKYSAMTGQSLFYLGETDIKHKILAIAEEQGAERATYALKLLQSEGELTIASTGKDPHTGRLVTQEYRVCGPVMIFLTTTAVEVDEELLNRCLVLTVDEDREQTRAIHRLQRERQTLEGLLSRSARTARLALHQNAQRLIRPLLVVNPYAPRLTFLDDRTRTRRDHMKYLTLIRTIALLHQYQRELKTVEHRGGVVTYVEATLEDIALANRLAHQVLGRSLDELAPQTRRLLMLLDEMVTKQSAKERMPRHEYRFSRRQVREYTGWSLTQVHVQMSRLLDFEYVIAHRGGRGQSFEYELAYGGQGRDGRPFLTGLIDVEALERGELGAPSTTETYPGLEATYPPEAGTYPGQIRPNSAAIPGGVQARNAAPGLEETFKTVLERENARLGSGAVDGRRTTQSGTTHAALAMLSELASQA